MTPEAAFSPDRDTSPFLVVLTGNPNCGKTTIFNALTGLRAKVGNYAGVTVERKEGRLIGAPSGRVITLLDLPGTYSLSPQSPDEQIARDVLLGRAPDVPPASLVIVVVDASNLERNLYFATQVIELGHPTLIALNMIDVAETNGQSIDVDQLQSELGVPVIPTVANTRRGLPPLRDRLVAAREGRPATAAPRLPAYPEAFLRETLLLGHVLAAGAEPTARLLAEAALILSDARNLPQHGAHHGAHLEPAVREARGRLEAAKVDWHIVAIESRYARVGAVCRKALVGALAAEETASDRIDRVVTHKIWGSLIFLAMMALMFQSIFTFAQLPMDLLESGVGWAGGQVSRILPPGDLQSLLVDGVIAGVGAVVIFVPQICLLFLFIGLLEDTGYMARAAFLMDRLMSKVGLHGKAFIPMLSSFACAIPGILSTRTIESPRDRLVTILIAPLMSCSARLPVYVLLIAACIPDRRVAGIFHLPGLTMLGMYLLGILVALAMAWLLKKTLLRGETPLLIMELPPYKRPSLRALARHVWDRAGQFLRNAGTIILGINILLWFLATYPRDANLERSYESRRAAVSAGSLADLPPGGSMDEPIDPNVEHQLLDLDHELAGSRLRHSFAGRLGRLIEPALVPLGFDWKIGIGIVASFAAREVFVSTMSVVYNVGRADDVETTPLAQTLRRQTREDGTPVYTTLTGLTLMVFYVIALQCVSTVAVVRRETGGWRWPAFQWLYMAGLAWLLAFVTYQGGRLLGYQ
ncbi:MAG: ferrous iron transport protein B [Limisphaerales bacterium]